MGEIVHGTLGAYTNKKCRCEECRDAARAYQKKRAERRKLGLPGAEDRTEDWRIVHGSRSRVEAGCECDVCLPARETYAELDAEAGRQKLARKEARREAAHGTRNGYNHYGCRCEACTNATKQHARDRKAKVKPEDTPVHGTRNGYTNYGCRCDECKKAGAAANKAYYDRTYVKKR